MVVNNQRVLSHLEVNMQTVQIYSQENPTVPIVMPLSKLTEVRPSVSAPGCFKLVGDANVLSLCPQAPQGKNKLNKIIIKRIPIFSFLHT